MSIFLSKYINKIDKKGRVSVPASYRSILSSQGLNGMVVYPSFKHKCIEVCSMLRLEQLSQIIQNLDPYSPERDAFETIMLGESVQLMFDSEGRVVVPEHLLEYSGVKEQVCFVGKGLVFEMWNLETFDAYLQIAKEIARENRFILKNINN